MNIEEFLTRSRRLLIHSKRPDRKEIWLTVRITSLGILAVGAIGYIIHILFTVITNLISQT
jgi:protein translocase SEC61 complex gamma subunit